jgi:peroxiredoxin
MADVMASAFYRDLMTPQLVAGDLAFPFELPTPDGRVVRLADFAGASPVALVFGSYT